jgi:hypothetical protein
LAYLNPISDPDQFYSYHPATPPTAPNTSPAIKVQVIVDSSQLPGKSWMDFQLEVENKIYCKHRRKMTRLGSLVYSMT